MDARLATGAAARRAAALCLLVGAIGCSDGSGPNDGGTRNGPIVFSSRRGDPAGERQQIYAIDPDGSNLRQLTHELSDGYTILPVAPGGARVVFRQVNGGVAGGLYTMRGDGGDRRGPFAFPLDDLFAVSPDGSRIAGVRLVDGKAMLSVGDLTTGEATVLPTGAVEVLDLFWSPDGARLGFTGRDPGTPLSDLFTIRATGSRLERLTTDEAGEWSPSWSPDGRSIAFTRQIPGEFPSLHVIGADGSGLRRLYLDPCTGDYPKWSPDSRRVICTNVRGESVAIIEAATGKAEPLRWQTPSGCSWWSPDGARLLCGNFHGVFLMDPDGSHQVELFPFDGGAPWTIWLGP